MATKEELLDMAVEYEACAQLREAQGSSEGAEAMMELAEAFFEDALTLEREGLTEQPGLHFQVGVPRKSI